MEAIGNVVEVWDFLEAARELATASTP